MVREWTVKAGKWTREPDLSRGSRHVVVTGAGGRYLNPLKERQRQAEMLYILIYNASSAHQSHLKGLINMALWFFSLYLPIGLSWLTILSLNAIWGEPQPRSHNQCMSQDNRNMNESLNFELMWTDDKRQYPPITPKSNIYNYICL